jgi:hypothetical protein
MTLCPVCRNAVPESATGYCPNCGASLTAPEAAPETGEASGPPPLPPLGSAPPPPRPPLAPAPVAGAPGDGRGRIPWDDRGGLGILTALVETTRDVLGSPTRFFRTMPVTGGIGSPLLYAVIVGWIGLVATALYQAVFRSIAGSSFGALGDRPEIAAALGFAESWGGFIVQAVFGGVFVVIGVLLGAGILHVMLLLLGGARRDFEATFRVVCFAQATSVVFLVPFCGQLIGAVWTLVLYVIGLAQAHEISNGKAAAAALLPLVLLCCCCAGLAILFAGALASIVPNVTP